MSNAETTARRACVSCGVNVSGMSAARFKCPVCQQEIYRCKRCRKQSTRYACPDCDFAGP